MSAMRAFVSAISLIAVSCTLAFMIGCGSDSATAPATDPAIGGITADQFSAFLESTRPGVTMLAEGHKTMSAAYAALASGDTERSATQMARAARLYDEAAAQLNSVSPPDAILGYGQLVPAIPGLADIARRTESILAKYASGELTFGQLKRRIRSVQQKTTGEMTAYADAADGLNAELGWFAEKLGLHAPEWLLELSRDADPAQGMQ